MSQKNIHPTPEFLKLKKVNDEEKKYFHPNFGLKV